MAEESNTYPVLLKGELTAPPARGWWLIKWLLGIPHYIILFFLWIAFIVVTVIAFFAILFTARYPKGLFEFNAGVLRWTWRVGFYSYQALGTDKYPPFTLNPADYPADLEIPYPERLSRGLVLVKWWLLAIPHWIIVFVIFCGMRFGWEMGSKGSGAPSFEGAGLIITLVIIAAIALLFTGKYPREIFKLVVGLNRWAYRFCAYVGLMTDKYPPFRLWD